MLLLHRSVIKHPTYTMLRKYLYLKGQTTYPNIALLESISHLTHRANKIYLIDWV
jgi:hypothetical protein